MVGRKLWFLCAGTALLLSTTAGQSGENPRGTPFDGGSFEASGVAPVHDGTAVLIVADNHPGDVIWMPLRPDGAQSGRVRPVSIGIDVDDPEDITTDGSWFYVVGSQSKSSEGAGLVRFRFDPAQRRVSTVETVEGLAAFLKEIVPELREASELDLEGLAWDPERSRLLVGLRAPLLKGDAVVVSLKLKDSRAPLSRANLVAAGDTLRLPLDGDAIRSLEYDRTTSRFHVIAGPSGDDRKDFRLLEWTGAPDGLRQITTFDSDLKPEGVTRVGDLILIVCDTSRFLVLRF